MDAERIKVLVQGIDADEAFADHFAALSRIARDRGDRSVANAFARHGRLHRVKAIEMRAILVAFGTLSSLLDHGLR